MPIRTRLTTEDPRDHLGCFAGFFCHLRNTGSRRCSEIIFGKHSRRSRLQNAIDRLIFY
jgi:hypothetical protein